MTMQSNRGRKLGGSRLVTGWVVAGLTLAGIAGTTSLAAPPQPGWTQEKPAKQESPKITLAELAGRRDLWPAKVTLRKPVRVSGSGTIPAGRELAVYEVMGAKVALDTGETLIEYAAADTDLLERALALMASLTPEALALTDKTLSSRPELWPLRLVMTRDLQFENGSVIPAGREVAFRGFEGTEISLFDRQSGQHFLSAVNETDLIARARQRMALPEKEREPYFLRAIEASVEKDGKIGAQGALGKADLILVYKGKLGCSRCAAFLPELKRFYEKTKPNHPSFEAVFMSSDSTAENAQAYLAEAKVPGLVLAYERRVEAANLATLDGGLLPLVYLFDREGKLLAQNHPNGGSPNASALLADVEKRLREKR